MKTVLHIKTPTVDDLAEQVISAQCSDDLLKVETADLTVEEPDYQSALEKIFEADSVAVW